MKKVFICSPYAGLTEKEIEYNIKYAKELCKFAIRMGFAPFASHLLYPQILNDQDPNEKRQGIAAGHAFLKTCDEFWIGIEKGTSEGMSEDLADAKKNGIPTFYVIKNATGEFSKHLV